MRSVVAMQEVDAVRIWFLTDNYYDALRPDTAVAHRYRTLPGYSIHAEHGLACYVETAGGGGAGACMFDFGLDPQGVSGNARLLGLDLGKVDAYVLSHGHHDHWGGAEEILGQNHASIAALTPFYAGEEAFCHRFSLRPGSSQPMDIGMLDRSAIEALGLKVCEIRTPAQIMPGGWSTGPITRSTDYERVPQSLLIMRHGQIVPDDFRGEQALFFNLKGKGLVILSGCAHVGIVNTIRHIQQISGIEKVHAVLGGLHLVNAHPDVLRQTLRDMQSIAPDYVVPAHCTGFEALVAFSREMPREFILNTAGTRYVFAA